MNDVQCVFCSIVIEKDNDECLCQECLKELKIGCDIKPIVASIMIIVAIFILMAI